MHVFIQESTIWRESKKQGLYNICCKNLIRKRDGKCSKCVVCARLCPRVLMASARSATAWRRAYEAKGLSAFAARQTVGGVWGLLCDDGALKIFLCPFRSDRDSIHTRGTKAESVFCTRSLAPKTKSAAFVRNFFYIYKKSRHARHTKITHTAGSGSASRDAFASNETRSHIHSIELFNCAHQHIIYSKRGKR